MGPAAQFSLKIITVHVSLQNNSPKVHSSLGIAVQQKFLHNCCLTSRVFLASMHECRHTGSWPEPERTRCTFGIENRFDSIYNKVYEICQFATKFMKFASGCSFD